MKNRLNQLKTRRLITILTFCLFFASCSDDDDTGINQNSSEINKQKLLDAVNSYRAKGCNCGSEYFPPALPVVWNYDLERAAKAHSEDMNSKNYFDHIGKDGSAPGERIKKYNYIWTAYGENIASGNFTEESVVKAWIGSPGHCVNIMKGAFKDMGVAKSGNYWTQELAVR